MEMKQNCFLPESTKISALKIIPSERGSAAFIHPPPSSPASEPLCSVLEVICSPFTRGKFLARLEKPRIPSTALRPAPRSGVSHLQKQTKWSCGRQPGGCSLCGSRSSQAHSRPSHTQESLAPHPWSWQRGGPVGTTGVWTPGVCTLSPWCSPWLPQVGGRGHRVWCRRRSGSTAGLVGLPTPGQPGAP